MNILKMAFCAHETLIYKGIGGGMGFLWRKIECNNCGKKFESLTLTSSFNDTYKINQILNKEDIDRFNDEVN